MRRTILAALCSLLVCGCGTAHPLGASRTSPATPQPQACHPRNPPSAGECIAQHFGITQPTTPPVGTELTTPTRSECADWSQWQGWAPNTAGLHCVIIQANFGLSREPSVDSQIADANAHHVPWGAYTFLEPGTSGAAEAQLADELTRNRGRTLGLWADAEVSGAYEHACSYTAQTRAEGVYIYGLFSAPGLWPGGRCEGLLWPSEWQIPRPYAFGGYPASSVVLWQDCGTCFRFGVQSDLDVNEGILERAHKPSPTHAQLEKELRADVVLRDRLRVLEGVPPAGHECRPGHGNHVTPDTRPYRHACDVWDAQGQQVDRQIAVLERELR